MAQCGEKVAFIDRRKAVDKLLVISNEHYRQNMGRGEIRKYFKTGESYEEGFLSSPIGWEMVSLRKNFAYERLKIALSSGIYLYWRKWFDRVLPEGEIYNFTNNFDKESNRAEVEFHSKMSTAFYICGVLVGLSGADLELEIGNHWYRER